MAELKDGANYDVIVIGGGAAGLVSSGFVSALGINVALISDGHPGGECLWTGCVPSKALIHSAAKAKLCQEYEGAFVSAMNHMKAAREKISHHDSVETIEKNYGVKVLIGRAKFKDGQSVKVDDCTLTASKFIIATGGYQAIPSIDGFDKVDCLTHESILELEKKPESLCIVGGGPVGVEYAQTMSRLGVKVYLVEFLDRLLPREEPEVSELVERYLKDEGVSIFTAHGASKAEKSGNQIKLTLKESKGDKVEVIESEKLMVATGKTPATKGLNLEKTGVKLDSKGFVITDEQQRTNITNIWACGDVCGLYQFTHYADHTAQIAALNTLYKNLIPIFKREKVVVPWCTFFDPEVASVGMRVEEAIKKYGSENIHILKYSLEDFDRAILDENAKGFMQAIVNKKGKILGVTIIGARAGEIIHEFALAMKNNIPITGLSKVIHVYPTMSAAIRNLSAQYYKTAAKDSFGLKFARTVAAWLS